MSHFTLLAQFTEEESNKILSYSTDSVRYQAMQNLLEEKLLPFKEGTSDLPEQYKEFCVAATVEELEQEFKVGKFSVLKDHDGRELPYSEKTYVEYYKTERAAKSAITRIGKLLTKWGDPVPVFEVMDVDAYNSQVPMIWVKNLMTGKPHQIRADTPWSCRPDSETYWSM